MENRFSTSVVSRSLEAGIAVASRKSCRQRRRGRETQDAAFFSAKRRSALPLEFAGPDPPAPVHALPAIEPNQHCRSRIEGSVVLADKSHLHLCDEAVLEQKLLNLHIVGSASLEASLVERLREVRVIVEKRVGGLEVISKDAVVESL